MYFKQEIEELITVLFKKSKQQLCLYIHQVANTEEWGLLSKDMQKDILEGLYTLMVKQIEVAWSFCLYYWLQMFVEYNPVKKFKL